jgi:hypothetical protein
MLKEKLEEASNRKRKFEVEFKTIIVSSLGPVPNFTIQNFDFIIGDIGKRFISLWLK